MSDIKAIIRDLDTVVEHGASDLHKAAKKEDHTPQELETIKNIAKIAYYHQVLKAMDESEDGYSERGYSGHYPMSPYSYGYDRGMSGARGGRRRDSIGRYSGNNSYRRGYSMDESRESILEKLEEAMGEATTERERRAIEQCMDKMSM